MSVSATARDQAAISISIARDPSLVRTVRLVAAAVARRAGVDEELVEEIRLAIGEACAVMVSGVTPEGGDESDADDKVHLRMEIADRLTMTVACAAAGDLGSSSYDGNGIDPWALLRGLADDLAVSDDAAEVAVSMSWPLGA